MSLEVLSSNSIIRKVFFVNLSGNFIKETKIKEKKPRIHSETIGAGLATLPFGDKNKLGRL